jgi:ornithine cyclodeaminase/alanine dehydrogenase-like protein (mu-crystallin family)
MSQTSIVLLSGRGIVVVSDAKNGRPLAVMDSIALTGIRTAATAALAAQYGARRDSTRTAIIGCGAQATYQLEALRSVFALGTVRVFDIDTARAEEFAAAHSKSDCTSRPRLVSARRSPRRTSA